MTKGIDHRDLVLVHLAPTPHEDYHVFKNSRRAR